MSGSVITIGAIPTPDDATTWLRSRVLDLLARGVPREPRDGRGDGWWHRPGALPWWELRTRVGGRVDAATFSGVAEGLIADGLVIEAWLTTPGRRAPSHVLLLPGHSAALKYPVVRARGHAALLAGEPWAPALEETPWVEVPGPYHLPPLPGSPPIDGDPADR